MRAGQIAPAYRPALLPLVALLLAVAGCGTRSAEQTSASPSSENESKAKATVVASGHETSAPRLEARPAGPTNRIRLSEKGCVQFEPHWTSIRVGQSLTWLSELDAPVRIHVSSGAFDRVNYVVPAGATLSTGPARTPGLYSIWTEPAACRDMPRGVQSSGPGVRVEGATQP